MSEATMTDEELCAMLRGETMELVGMRVQSAARLEALRAERDAALARAERAEANLGIETLNGRHYERVAEEWKKEAEKQKERAEKYMWQVRDTCARAEKAEAEKQYADEAYKQIEADNARLRELAEALADAADDVGVQHFDTDTIPGYVGTMQAATLAVRAALAPVEAKGGDDGR